MNPFDLVTGTPRRTRCAAAETAPPSPQGWFSGELVVSLGVALCIAGCGDSGDSANTQINGSSIIANSPASSRQSVNNLVGSAAAVSGLPPLLAGVTDANDPGVLLGTSRVVDNPYQPSNRIATSPFPLIKVAALSGPFPTGKWSKGFLYQTPADLTANFNNAPPWDPLFGKNGKND
ncbi:MAG: hypothetical protein ACMG51_09875, partial [Ginsengibacter sp.]